MHQLQSCILNTSFISLWLQWGGRGNCAKSLSSRYTEGPTAVCGIIIAFGTDNERVIAARQSRVDGLEESGPVDLMSTKRMCALLAGFVSRARDGHPVYIGAGLMPREGRDRVLFAHAASHPNEQTHTLMASLEDF